MLSGLGFTSDVAGRGVSWLGALLRPGISLWRRGSSNVNNGGMARDHAGRADPIGRFEDLRTMNAELVHTTGKLIETMAEQVAAAHRLVEESQRLRQERRAFIASTRLGTRRAHGPSSARCWCCPPSR